MRYDEFAVADAGDQVPVVDQAEPRSRSVESLALLGTIASAGSGGAARVTAGMRASGRD